jgi:hypothetical protein
MDDRCSIPGSGRDLSLRHHLRTGYWGPASLQWVPASLFPGVKLPGREDDNSPHPVTRLRMRGAIPPLPHESTCRGI